VSACSIAESIDWGDVANAVAGESELVKDAKGVGQIAGDPTAVIDEQDVEWRRTRRGSRGGACIRARPLDARPTMQSTAQRDLVNGTSTTFLRRSHSRT